MRAEENIGRRGGRTFVGSGNGEGGEADGAGEAVAGTPVDILSASGSGGGSKTSIPVPFRLNRRARYLKQTIRAEVTHYFVVDAAWTSYLIAVLAVEQVLQGKK